MTKLPKKTIERIYLTRDQFADIEQQMRHQEHLRRYGLIRRFCFGKVLDFACGCGYGTYMLAQSPDVESVTGIDQDPEALRWAKHNFSHPKATYRKADARLFTGKVDTLVSLETIEHIRDRTVVPKLAERVHAEQVIVSFPDKKSTHYNPHHVHDFARQDVVDLFPNFVLYHEVRFGDSVSLLFSRHSSKAPSDLFRNIRDL